MRRSADRAALLTAIGARVRTLRLAAGWTRAALALRARVSVRYLAQLESGQGNISIARLAEVTAALGVTLGALLHDGPTAAASSAAGGTSAEPSWTDAAERSDARYDPILRHLRRCSAAELAEVEAWLGARFARTKAPMVALLGLRGAGKSTIGPRLARRLGLRFVELDALVEKTAGLALAELFALHGEGYFRRLERETLRALLSEPEGAVIATGGAIVNDEDSFALLRRRAITVWLKARPEDHWNRVIQQGDHRPMAQHPHAMAELRALLAARAPRYGEAQHVVDTARLDVEAAVDALARALTPAVMARRWSE